ncbi:MAG: dTDP-4-dehydrorhamnose 3,5-epimerase [Planctomycetes bacterium]|nr:dTDP-4-dehydrorhamnose 3,5-epimerase [Planctomycetota bacterium]
MRFLETPLSGACVIEPERLEDERGFFARCWCRDEFHQHGLNPDLAQCSISFNRRRHTLRGMHYQRQPHAETKLVRCTTGAIFDVIIDLRSQSPTYCQWFGVELTAENRRMLYIPPDFAHGFLTLSDQAELFYQMSDMFVPGSGTGVRWNDTAFGIQWPTAAEVISERDNSYPDFATVCHHDISRSVLS